jgi:putative oxidoreductase
MAAVGRPTFIIPSLGALYDSLADYAYPLVRFTMGAVLVPHGMQKLFGMYGAPAMDVYVKAFADAGAWAASPFWVYLIGCVEFIGGICLAIGLLTRFWAVLCVLFMAVATFGVHWPNGWFWLARGFEVPASWGLIYLAILIKGGGKLSVDRAIGKEF